MQPGRREPKTVENAVQESTKSNCIIFLWLSPFTLTPKTRKIQRNINFPPDTLYARLNSIHARIPSIGRRIPSTSRRINSIDCRLNSIRRRIPSILAGYPHLISDLASPFKLHFVFFRQSQDSFDRNGTRV